MRELFKVRDRVVQNHFSIFFGIVAKWLGIVLTCLIVVVAVIYLF